VTARRRNVPTSHDRRWHAWHRVYARPRPGHDPGPPGGDQGNLY